MYLPLNRTKFLWKSANHRRHQKTIDAPCENAVSHPAEFDAEYLRNYFASKTYDFVTVNVKHEKLTSPVENSSDLARLDEVEDIERILADNNRLQLEDFLVFSNVSILSLRYNNLSLVAMPSGDSGDGENFKHLSQLDLSHNNLESNCLSQLNRLSNLRELKLNHNRIRFFTDGNNLSGLTKLVRLELCYNGIESCRVFLHLSSLPSLQELLLNDNYLRCIPLLLRSEAAAKFNELSGGGGDVEKQSEEDLKEEGELDREPCKNPVEKQKEVCSEGQNCIRRPRRAKSEGDVQTRHDVESIDNVKAFKSRSLEDNFDSWTTSDESFDSDQSTSSLDSDETGFLLTNVYHRQTPEVLGAFRPRTLSTLYEGSEQRSGTSCSSPVDGVENEDCSSEEPASSSDSEKSVEISADVIPICHVPFPRLHSLHVKFNRFGSEASLLGVSPWPNLRAVHVRGNGVTDDFLAFDKFEQFNVLLHYS